VSVVYTPLKIGKDAVQYKQFMFTNGDSASEMKYITILLSIVQNGIYVERPYNTQTSEKTAISFFSPTYFLLVTP